MARLALKTLLQLVFVLLGVSIVVFGLARLSGDPATLLLPPEASDADRQAFRAAYGLDRPLPQQYLAFAGHALRGDFGKSLAFGSPALDLLLHRLPATAELAGAAMLIVVLLGVPAGIVAALLRGQIVDRLVMLLAVLGQSMATFWLGIMLILFFAVNWHLFPPSGRGSLRTSSCPR